METQLVPATPAAIVPATGFDPSILAGQVSPNTLSQYAADFRLYLAYAGSPQAALQPSTLARWRQSMLETGYTTRSGKEGRYSVAAINRRLSSVRKVLAEAAQQGYVSHETAEGFKRVKGLTLKANKDRRNEHARTRITPEDMDLICAAPDLYANGEGAKRMHRAFLLTLRYSGARITDVVTLCAGQIEWYTNDEGRSGWVAMFQGKNETEPVAVELGGKAKAAIDEWLTYRRDVLSVDVDSIFTGFTGRGDRNPSATPIHRVSAWGLVQHYARLVGLEHIKPHDFRRYVGTQLARKDIRLAQKQLRHKRIETTAAHYVLDDVQLGHMDSL